MQQSAPTNFSDHQSHGRMLNRLRKFLQTAVCFAITCVILCDAATAQFDRSATQAGDQRQTLKVDAKTGNLPSAAKALESTSPGATFFPAATEFVALFEGRQVPSTLKELKALEAQQAKIAKLIEPVTVNVQQGMAQGSGVIITPDGYVLTAAHVAGDHNREAWVVMKDGRRLRAKTLGMNRFKDAGLLKITESVDEPFQHATLGRSRDLHIGQWVVAAGHPGGWKSERGAVIRVGRVLEVLRGPPEKRGGRSTPHTLFTDCALIGGDSGGPLFTLEGKLIGIHSRIGTDVEDNMHVPIDVFDESWDRMVRGEVWGVLPGFKAAIGVLGTLDDDRPLISEVIPGGPAHRAGLAPGDLVLTFDGVEITTFAELQMGVGTKVKGDVVELVVLRDNKKHRLFITVDVTAKN